MPLSDEKFHLDSDEHKSHHIIIWCEECNKYIYLMKQDIFKVKFISRKVNKGTLVKK